MTKFIMNNGEEDWDFKGTPVSFEPKDIVDYGKDTITILISYTYLDAVQPTHVIDNLIRVKRKDFNQFLLDYIAYATGVDNDGYYELPTVHSGKIIWKKSKFHLENYQYSSTERFIDVFEKIREAKHGS